MAEDNFASNRFEFVHAKVTTNLTLEYVGRATLVYGNLDTLLRHPEGFDRVIQDYAYDFTPGNRFGQYVPRSCMVWAMRSYDPCMNPFEDPS